MSNNFIKHYLGILGTNIEHFRKRGKLTQEEVAEKADLALSTVQGLEHGRNVTLENLLKICQALKLDPSTLFISPEEKEKVTGLQKKFWEDMNEFFNKYFKREH